MVFSDLFFLFVFLPAFALCYLLAGRWDKQKSLYDDQPTHQLKNWVLVFFSLIFYAWGEPVYVFLMLACVFINYLAGLAIHHTEKWKRKLSLTIGLAANLLILGTFKYLGFFADTLSELGFQVSVPHISLPIGISFYTFQSISYLVDVFRKESPVQHRFGNLLLYISMFPQLIAGPIVRYGTVAHELKYRHVTSDDFADGSFRFLCGLGKKVILANQLSEISDQFLVNGLGDLSTAGAWIGIVAFTLQIYFDFSGYSDMAIGMGRCMGFHFNENFDHPYCSRTVSEFWRRWHMSLGSFFRDYVYIPMGGNRRHQAVNILTVWFLTGMWHGASWNFILWGLYYGLIVSVEKFTVLRAQSKVPSPLLHLYCMLLVVIGWGIFYFDDFNQMVIFFQSLVGHGPQLCDFAAEASLTDNFWLWVTAILFCMPLRKWCNQLLDCCLKPRGTMHNTVVFASRLVVSVVLLTLSVALLVGATNNAFIYTRF